MTNNALRPKKPILTPELYAEYPLWFKGAIAYRLLRIMTPKPLTRRLPRVLRKPLLRPGFSFPPGWVLGDPLPPGLILPEGVFFPPGWKPGDPLPDGYLIDTALYFSQGWITGDPLPPSLTLPMGETLPPDWTPGDSLPDGSEIDTSTYFPQGWQPGDSDPDGYVPPPPSFSDIPGITSPVPPTYISPSEPAGPITPPRTALGPAWNNNVDDTYWSPVNVSSWNSTLLRWDTSIHNPDLRVTGTWASGYRPTKFRMNLTSTPVWAAFWLRDGNSQTIASASPYTLLDPIDITYNGTSPDDDIDYIGFDITVGSYITNLEFFS